MTKLDLHGPKTDQIIRIRSLLELIDLNYIKFYMYSTLYSSAKGTVFPVVESDRGPQARN